MKTTSTAEIFVGIDVSKDTLDIFITGKDKQLHLSNDVDGYKKLCRNLKKLSPKIIVLEGTGGLERCAASWMSLEGLPVAIVNPCQVRRYAQAHNILAKTDRIDAQIIAKFAKDILPEARYVVDKERDRLRALHTRRSQLIKERTRQINQRSRAFSSEVLPSYDTIIRAINKELENIEKRINQIIDNSLEYREKIKILKSMKGIGTQTARTMLAYLPELGLLNRYQIASLAGLAPFNNDSGKYRGKRSIKGGRSQVRKTLYMATLSATRHNPRIRDFYNHLKNKGKLEKVARTACMRKMLIILNAMIKDKCVFQPEMA